MRRALLICTVVVMAAAAASADDRVDLKLDFSEADAVLAILAKNSAHKPIEGADWQRLFTSTPYVRLKEREASLHRDFTDEEFQRFVLSPQTVGRASKLRTTVEAWKRADLTASANRALAYLPAEARIRTAVFPCIKPRKNSFVTGLTTATPAIFLYVDPDVSAAQFENTVAHEMHHIGLGSLSAAYEKRIDSFPVNARKAAEWMGAFGEGVAMLAAAGSPDINPVTAFSKDDQAQWRLNIGNWEVAFSQVEQFFADVVEGGFARLEVADHVGMTFLGYRGPWYQVGYKMAVTIEKELGRRELIATMADPRDFVARYNEAAQRINARGEEKLPLFRKEILDAVGR